MRVSVSTVSRESDELVRNALVEFDLGPSPEHPDTLAIDDIVAISNTVSIRVTASYAPSTRQLFVFVKEGDEHIFSAIGKIGDGIQYFAFCLTDNTFTELSFSE